MCRGPFDERCRGLARLVAHLPRGHPQGAKVNGRTYAGDLFAGKQVDDRPSQVDGDAWSDSRWAADMDLFEHSKKVAGDSVLTFLWHRS
jgi:hypothetical protein